MADEDERFVDEHASGGDFGGGAGLGGTGAAEDIGFFGAILGAGRCTKLHKTLHLVIKV